MQEVANMEINVEHAIPERDAALISHLIDICRGERRTVLNKYSPEEERAYLENMGPRQAVFVASAGGEFAGFAGIAPRWGYSERLRHCGECGTCPSARIRNSGTSAPSSWRTTRAPSPSTRALGSESAATTSG